MTTHPRKNWHLERMMALLVLPCIAACGGEPSTPTAPQEPALIPLPTTITSHTGAFTLDPSARIATMAGAEAVGDFLAAVLRPATGFDLPVVAADAKSDDIALRLDAASESALGPEGYRLEVTSQGITVTAGTNAGLFYGCQSLRQLFPAELERGTLVSGVAWTIPEVSIEDVPRFEWRGAMLDVARHFFDVAEIKRYIDLIAYHKMNRLHLHLTDDQGWRIEIKSWPNLTAVGGSTEVGGGPGGFYTQEDIVAIVNHAASRFVTVVPEIDMPGHVHAALASYGELNPSGMPPAPYTGTDVGFSSLWLEGPVTAMFVSDVIGEVAALFPSPYFHIGGDEAKMTLLGDYITFIEGLQKTLEANNKTLVGWDEIGAAKLQPPFYAQYWLSDAKARAARDAGAKIICSPVSFAYLDIKYNSETPIGQAYIGFTDVQKAYSWDPIMAGLTDTDVVGVEAPLWTETVATRADIDFLAFPRLAGHAEIAWSPKENRDWETYRVRLARHGKRLDALGVGFYRTDLVDW